MGFKRGGYVYRETWVLSEEVMFTLKRVLSEEVMFTLKHGF